MKGHFKAGRLVATLVATAALGFAQVGGLSNGPNTIRATQSNGAITQRQQAGPGTLNYTEGQVSIDGQPIAQHASGNLLQLGQTLETGVGYAEVLLTPGAFLRVGNNSEAKLVNAGLVNTTVQLGRGEAIVEVDQLLKNSNLAVVVGGATVELEKKGLYDFDANQSAVRVLDGKAKVTEAAGVRTIGKDDQMLLGANQPLKKSDFNSKTIKAEPLYTWSEARGQYESQANLSAANYVISNGGWYGPGWYWDPYLSFYSFVPGSGFLYSPFGWGFYSPGFVYSYGPYFGYRVPYGYRAFYGHAPGFYARANAFHSGVAPALHSAGSFRGGFVGGGFHGGRR